MKPSLQDIAERAGVSTATVSRALNDRDGVNAETRTRVLQVAQELGYVANASARGLATARTYTLGVITYERPPQQPISNFPDETLQGIDQQARQHSYHIITTFVSEAMMQDAQSIPLVTAGRVDGLILIGPALKAAFIIQLYSTGIPIVLVDNVLSETNIDAVVCDNVGGTYALTRHLIDAHARRNLVFLSGPKHWFSSRERRSAYTQALVEDDLLPRMVYMPDTTMSMGHAAMLEALARYPELDGVVAVNDASAFGAIRACKENGLRVPEDVAVVGFDNVGWAPHHDPPLTTVRMFRRETGIQAARHLIDKIDRESSPGFQLRLGIELILRESCGCAPSPLELS